MAKAYTPSNVDKIEAKRFLQNLDFSNLPEVTWNICDEKYRGRMAKLDYLTAQERAKADAVWGYLEPLLAQDVIKGRKLVHFDEELGGPSFVTSEGALFLVDPFDNAKVTIGNKQLEGLTLCLTKPMLEKIQNSIGRGAAK